MTSPNYQINAGYDPNVILPLFGGGTGHLFHEPTVRTDNLSPAWNESHFDIDQQTDGTFKMDRFALTSHSVSSPTDPKGLRALGQYDQTDLPYYYELATQFATSDSFHSSLLANTIPNRQYMFCATSPGKDFPIASGSAAMDLSDHLLQPCKMPVCAGLITIRMESSWLALQIGTILPSSNKTGSDPGLLRYPGSPHCG